MMPGMFLGIDLGTSEVKALLMDEAATFDLAPVARTPEPWGAAGASCGDRLAPLREAYPALAPLWKVAGRTPES